VRFYCTLKVAELKTRLTQTRRKLSWGEAILT
jgi:hypothetical protein